MENNLMGRYIYDVVRRLPEKEQADARKQLEKSIQEKLSDGYDEADLRKVLIELGPPTTVADYYRKNPRYVISPAVYDEYIHVLKWLIPTIAGILAVLGMATALFDILNSGNQLTTGDIIGKLISQGVSTAVSGAFQAVVWVTIGFMLAERHSNVFSKRNANWKPEDLPEVPVAGQPKGKSMIPLADSIIELVLVVFFTSLLILIFLDKIPINDSFRWDGQQVEQVFNPAFLRACIPAMVITGVLNVVECIWKIASRKWTPALSLYIIVNNILCLGIVYYVLRVGSIFSNEFLTFVQKQEWSDGDLMRIFSEKGENAFVIGVMTIMAIVAIVECSQAIYKTMKTSKLRREQASLSN